MLGGWLAERPIDDETKVSAVAAVVASSVRARRRRIVIGGIAGLPRRLRRAAGGAGAAGARSAATEPTRGGRDVRVRGTRESTRAVAAAAVVLGAGRRRTDQEPSVQRVCAASARPPDASVRIGVSVLAHALPPLDVLRHGRARPAGDGAAGGGLSAGAAGFVRVRRCDVPRLRAPAH